LIECDDRSLEEARRKPGFFIRGSERNSFGDMLATRAARTETSRNINHLFHIRELSYGHTK
jgi:hypothetical protein